MLSWSSDAIDEPGDDEPGDDERDGPVTPDGFDLAGALGGDGGVEHGRELVAFATASTEISGPAPRLLAARQALVAVAGVAAMVDAAAVAANFQMMTRLADGTGARHEGEHLARASARIGKVGIGRLPSRR